MPIFQWYFNQSGKVADMLRMLGKSKVLITSLALMLIMFVIVMFFVNPSIDGADGSGVLKLQLSFEKNTGIEIIKNWGESGINNFHKWIFTDYIYSFSYSIFLASLISCLAMKTGKETRLDNLCFVFLAFFSGALDFLENTIELYFIKNPYDFSNNLFFIHSIFAAMKWTVVTIVIVYIFVQLVKKKSLRF